MDTVEVKLLMSWDILPGREEDYFEFHIREFLPSLEKMGLTLSEAWLTVYGNYPRLKAEAIVPSLAKAKKMLLSNDWDSLYTQLEDFVENFEYKIINKRTRWQM
jgi:hypothetical protein